VFTAKHIQIEHYDKQVLLYTELNCVLEEHRPAWFD